MIFIIFFFQAEDGIRDLVRSRGLGDVYKRQLIQTALQEDVKNGDITTKATISKLKKAVGKFLVKADGIIAGLEIAKTVFRTVDPKIKFEIKIKDGSNVKFGDVVALVSGKAQSLLTAERTALNFLQRMSGIATAANTYAEKVKHTKTKIIDTRKTVPGLRTLDKLAVKLGGLSLIHISEPTRPY